MKMANSTRREMKDILVLFEGKDSASWRDFIVAECLNDCPQKLKTEDKDLNTCINDVEAIAKKFSMVLIIVSAEMLNTLQSQRTVLEPCLRNHSCVSVIKLYIDENSYNAKLVRNYSCAKDWKSWNINEQNTEEDVQKIISEIIDAVENLAVPTCSLPPPRARTGQIQLICPDSIRQGGEMVVIVLRNAIKEGQCVQVAVGEDEKMIDTETLNPYCFRFKAPAHKAGRADIRLFKDGKKICKTSVHYKSMLKFAYTCPSYLCQLIGLNADDYVGLDKELSSIFKASSPEDGTLQHLLTPKNLRAISSVTGGSESCGELPTLLHFACRYGLNDLAVSIAETPGSQIAMNMDNERGLKPLDLAEEANNEELVNFLECLIDMHDYVIDIEDIYERMSGGKSLESYINQAAAQKGDGYLMMKGRDSMPEPYAECRLHGTEPDYETTSPSRYFVQEVAPQDDIISEPAPPVPERHPSVGKSKAPPPRVEDAGVACRPRDIPLKERSVLGHSAMAVPEGDYFAGQSPMSPHSLGSSNLDELNQYAEAYKRGEFNLDDIQRLYRAWNERNRENTSCSLKERKKQLDDLKNQYQTVLSLKKQKTQRKFFSRKKAPEPELDIQHHPSPEPPNKYESWNIMKGQVHTLPRNFRESTVSNASTTSSSSSSSRDSALGGIMEADSDDVAPEVPMRRSLRPDLTEKQQHRLSWGEEFLKSVQNRPHSRLPRPPATPVYCSRLPTTPEVPPRPPVSKKPSR